MTFNFWQVLRIVAFGYVFWADSQVLNQCEYWVNDVDAMIAKYGWNDLMYQIAMNAVCDKERTRFFICAAFFFLLFLYVTWCTHRYVEEVGRVPRHLLRVPKDATSGAWYSHSLGEKQHMNGFWGGAQPRQMPDYGASE